MLSVPGTVGGSLGQDRVEWPEACPVWGRTAKAPSKLEMDGERLAVTRDEWRKPQWKRFGKDLGRAIYVQNLEKKNIISLQGESGV